MKTLVFNFKDVAGLGIMHAMLGINTRDLIIKYKGIFTKALIWFAKRLPEPTRENVIRPNSKVLLDMRDEFFKCEDNGGRHELFEAIWKIFIVEYEHDIYYSNRIDWLVEQAVNRGWHPRPCGHPNTCWKEEEPYGGGYLIKDETLLANRKRFKILETQDG